MIAQPALLDQLEEAVSGKDLGRRAEVLRRITDLFFAGDCHYSGEQLKLFDDVMMRLTDCVEIAAAAQFGARMAEARDPPPATLRKLAFESAIEVAEPVLTSSEVLSEQELIRHAASMSQAHLLAVSKRRALTEGLTDVLVTRGDREVLISTARNAGARLSEGGLVALVDKAEGDEGLSLSVWFREDISRQHMVKLFRQASEGLRLQLEAARPQETRNIRAAVARATVQMQALARDGSAEFNEAAKDIPALHRDGKLDEAMLGAFIDERSFDKVCLSLSLLCELPIALVEQAMAQGRFEQVMVFAKTIGLSWPVTLALMQFQADQRQFTEAEIDQYFASYSRLQPKTARTALQFYRMRATARKPS